VLIGLSDRPCRLEDLLHLEMLAPNGVFEWVTTPPVLAVYIGFAFDEKLDGVNVSFRCAEVQGRPPVPVKGIWVGPDIHKVLNLFEVPSAKRRDKPGL
jgi:hypothetical protein